MRRERAGAQLGQAHAERIKYVLDANLNSAFYCSSRRSHHAAAEGRLLIHTASWAGRFVGIVPGRPTWRRSTAWSAMSYSINMEEFQHGIRSTVLCPNEVATRSSICARSRSPPRSARA
jgi:NAD(P)-dependent dehydrogenase (short-subunit alcohol dehydrogenase family)